MHEPHETELAQLLRDQAQALAMDLADWRDLEAATVAILVRALELATPGWSVLGRASLFTGDDDEI